MLRKISDWCFKYIQATVLILITIGVTVTMCYIYANNLPTENDRNPAHMVNTIMNHQKNTANISSPEENVMPVSPNQISKDDNVEDDKSLSHNLCKCLFLR